jgi:hypothetical protein
MTVERDASEQRDTYGLVAAVLLALAARVAACGIWASDLTLDRDAYWGIARQILAGHGFCTPGTTQPTAFRAPLYPLLLAGAGWLLSPAWATGVVNVGAGIGTVVSTWWSARLCRLSPRHNAWAAGLIAVDPLLVRYTAQPMTECVFAALSATLVGLLLSAGEGPRSGRRWLCSGVVAGLAALCRPTIWPFALLVSLAVLVVQRRNMRAAILAVSCFWLGMLGTVGPWAARNAWVMGWPIVTTTHGGYTLLLGNNPVFYAEVASQPWGTVWTGPGLERWQRELRAEMEQALGPSAGEVASDRWQTQRAWQHMRRDKHGFVHGVLYRVRSLWSLSPRGEHAGTTTWPIAAWYGALLVLAAWGMGRVLMTRGGITAWVLLGWIVSVQAVHVFYWTDTRMRAPLHPVLAITAAACLCGRSTACRSLQRPS